MATLDQAHNYSPTVVGLLTQIGLASATSVACILGFEFMRRRPSMKYIYETKSMIITNPSPRIPKFPLVWFFEAFKRNDDFYLTHAGLDATMHLYFLRMTMYFLLINSVIVGCILIPVNWHASSGEPSLLPNPTVWDRLNSNSTLERISIENVPDGSGLLWFHLLATYCISITWMYILQRSAIVYLRLRGMRMILLLEKNKGVHLRTLLVRGIPIRWMDGHGLKEYFEGMGFGSVEKVMVVRKFGKLGRKIKRREAKLVELEEECIALGKAVIRKAFDEVEIEGNKDFGPEPTVVQRKDISREGGSNDKEEWWPPSNPSASELVVATTNKYFFKSRVVPWPSKSFWNILLSTSPSSLPDKPLRPIHAHRSIQHVLVRLCTLKEKINHLRDTATGSVSTSAAFVTFVNWRTAHAVAQSVICRNPSRMRCTLAPEPRDVAWANLVWGYKREYFEGHVRWWIVNLSIWALTIFWLFPISFILGLTTLDSLSQHIAVLKPFLDQSSSMRLFISNVLPTLLVTLFMAVLPVMLLKISQQQLYPSNSALEYAVMKRYYHFSVFNVLIVFLLGQGFIESFVQVFHQPTFIVDILGNTLPKGWAFFLNYIAFNTSGHFIELIQLVPQLLCHPILTSRLNSQTPRTLAASKKPYTFPYYYYYPIHLLVLTIIQTYSIIQPLVLWFGVAYFLLALVIYRHQHAHAYIRAYESAGVGFRLAVRYSSDGLVLLQLTMCGLLILKDAFVTGALVVPLLVFTIWFKFRMRGRMGSRAKYLAIGGELDKDIGEEWILRLEAMIGSLLRNLWGWVWGNIIKRWVKREENHGAEERHGNGTEFTNAERAERTSETNNLELQERSDRIEGQEMPDDLDRRISEENDENTIAIDAQNLVKDIDLFPKAMTLQSYPDDSYSPCQSYDQPALAEPLNETLYLPMNPCNPGSWNLDKCIEVSFEHVFGGPNSWIELKTTEERNLNRFRRWTGGTMSMGRRDVNIEEGRKPYIDSEDESSDDENKGN